MSATAEVRMLREVLSEPISRSRLEARRGADLGGASFRFARRREIAHNPLGMRGENLPNVPGLAASILAHGLLENLLVVTIPEALRRSEFEWLQLKAGSRRLAAIDLLLSQGHLDEETDLIPVRLLDGDGFWEHAVENLQRQDCKPWQTGRYLLGAIEAGASHATIGAHVGRSQGWVSRFVAIGRGLSPEAIAWLEERGIEPKIYELQRVASIVDRFGDPDGPEQVRALEKTRGGRRAKVRRDAASVASWHNRVEHLRSGMPVPPLIRPVVAAVLDYLERGVKPDFRAAEAAVVERGRSLYGPEED